MFRIGIRMIRKLLSLPDPDPLGRGTDPDPPVIKKKNSKKPLDFYCFVTSILKVTDEKSWIRIR
jgi:hypothetical protein